MQTSSSDGKPLVILNPAANRGNIARYRAAIKRALVQEDAEYVETTKPGEATTLAKMAATDGRPVVFVGGDGTLNEVASGILASGKRVPLGIVPAGSGNDFAWNTMKLPHDSDAAIAIALHGSAVPVDAGMVNGHYFVNSFSVGLDGDITVAASTMKRWPFMSGWMLYYGATLRQLLFGYRHCPWMQIRIDDEAISGPAMKRYVLAAVMNGPTYGAGFHICPKADHTDGAFTICTADYTPQLRAFSLLPLVQKGQHEGQKEIHFYAGQVVHIETRAPTNAQMDGEVMRATIYDVRILPAALLVRAPTAAVPTS